MGWGEEGQRPDRQMFVDALAQSLALVEPELDDPDGTAESMVGIIGVWVPATREVG